MNRRRSKKNQRAASGSHKPKRTPLRYRACRRITDIVNGRRAISTDTAVRLGRYFGNRPQFWLDLQSQYDIAVIERDHGVEISRRVRPTDAA